MTVQAKTETLEGFLASRDGWLRVETVDRPNGCWDVVLRIDGTYRGESMYTKQEMVEYFRKWLLPLLLDAGIAPHRLRSWDRSVPPASAPTQPGLPARAASIKECAGRFKVHSDTIRRRISDGELTAYRIGHNIIRIDLDEAEALFRS